LSFFIDTNIVAFCLRGRSAAAMLRFQATPVTEIFLPMQVHAELLIGVVKSTNSTQSKVRLMAFIAPFRIAWPDSQVEEDYVAIRSALEKLGTPISEQDL
jgi:tRNA(fMet)-specific endonuclease VapC